MCLSRFQQTKPNKYTHNRDVLSETPTAQHQMPTTRTRLIAPPPDGSGWVFLFPWKGRYQGEVGKVQVALLSSSFFECKQPGGFIGSWLTVEWAPFMKFTSSGVLEQVDSNSGKSIVLYRSMYILRIWLILFRNPPMSQSVQQGFCGTFGLQVRTTQGKEQVKILNCRR